MFPAWFDAYKHCSYEEARSTISIFNLLYMSESFSCGNALLSCMMMNMVIAWICTNPQASCRSCWEKDSQGPNKSRASRGGRRSTSALGPEKGLLVWWAAQGRSFLRRLWRWGPSIGQAPWLGRWPEWPYQKRHFFTVRWWQVSQSLAQACLWHGRRNLQSPADDWHCHVKLCRGCQQV